MEESGRPQSPVTGQIMGSNPIMPANFFSGGFIMSGYGAKEARYNTRLAKQTREQVNLCGACGEEIAATELLCTECRGTLVLLDKQTSGQ